MRDFTRRAVIAGGLAGVAALAVAPLFAQAAPPFGTIERLDPALDALIDADAPVELLLPAAATWSEGPTWVGGRDGYLLFSDVPGDRIHRWDRRAGDSVWLEPSGWAGSPSPAIREGGANGLYAARGGLLIADSGNRCVSLIDLATKRRTVLADRFEGKRFNSPNDLCVSPRDGAIYFTDPAYGLTDTLKSPLREMDYTGVFRIARDGALSLIGKFAVPNGIGISPDGGTLYHTEINIGWTAHKLDKNGASAEKRTFVDTAATGITGGDGLTLDARGNLWASSRGGLSIFTPAGRRIGIIHTESNAANCEIGADGYLYMTCATKLARVKVKAPRFPV